MHEQLNSIMLLSKFILKVIKGVILFKNLQGKFLSVFSSTLERVERRDIGRKLVSTFLFPDLNIGTTVAIFSIHGKNLAQKLD